MRGGRTGPWRPLQEPLQQNNSSRNRSSQPQLHQCGTATSYCILETVKHPIDDRIARVPAKW